jgi:hypothetical protein
MLSPESKYSWNKIVSEQMESNPFVNLQGVSLEGPRGMNCKSFNGCIMFHFLTAFPINAAEQEKYYILNVLKKPQCVNVRQIVRPVEQLNAYITQMPCFYYSPNANASTKPKNVPFTEAELGSLYVPYPVTGPLQYEQEGHDTNGHVLASDFVGIDLTHLHLQEGQIGIF